MTNELEKQDKSTIDTTKKKQEQHSTKEEKVRQHSLGKKRIKSFVMTEICAHETTWGLGESKWTSDDTQHLESILCFLRCSSAGNKAQPGNKAKKQTRDS